MSLSTATRTIVMTILVLGAIGIPLRQHAGFAAADALLDGRLGGTRASFEQRYGDPVSGTPEQGADYAVPQFGTVFVQFKLASDPDRPNRIVYRTTPESPAIVIAISAPREIARSATSPDPRDWTLDEARSAAASFLPTDVDLGEIVIDGTSGSAPCRSEALTAVFTNGTNACRVGFVLPTPTTVSFATLVLAPVEAKSDGPRNPCSGLATWSRDSSARLAAAQSLLNQLASIDETDPNATTDLTDISSAFTALADEQRDVETPPVADRVRDLLVDALTSYADAASAAAEGISTNDSTQIDAAVDAITAAETTIQRATTLLERALNGCGLSSGTPEASSGGS